MANRTRIWFSVHGWLSLPIWLLFSFVCLTGTVSVISHEITWLINPSARAANPHDIAPKPANEIVAAVEEAVPGAAISHVLFFEPYLASVVGFSSSEMPAGSAYVNQYTGEVQEIFPGQTFPGFMRALHGWLFFPWHHRYSVGYYVVTVLSVVVLGAVLSGLYIYKKFWRAFLRPTIRVNKGARAFVGDLHKTLGAWSMWFLLIIGSTGFWYLTQALLWHNAVDVWEEPAPISVGALASNKARPEKASFGEMIRKVQQRFPDFTPSYIAMPEHNLAYLTVTGRGTSMLYDEYSYRAIFNPWNGDAVEWRSPEVMNALQTVSHIADPLHYGKFGGLITKAIWFMFGLIVSTMSLTGFVIWSKRTLSEKTRRVPRSPLFLNAALVFAPAWFLYSAFNTTPAEITFSPKAIGNVASITPMVERSVAPYKEGDGYQVDFSFALCNACSNNFKIAYARIGVAPLNLPDTLDGILHGHGDMLHAHVPAPRELKPTDKLWITVIDWQGQTYSEHWDITRKTAR